MKHALLAGYGGIGKNVYYPELEKLGYVIDIFDTVHEQATIKKLKDIPKGYELAVICTPNFTHEDIAIKLAENDVTNIFVEKPGVQDSYIWRNLVDDFPHTRFHVVKNNLYRASYGDILNQFHTKDVVFVDINWLNKNRIPNPGNWFTDKTKSYGGVSRDLMPHLYSFAFKLFNTAIDKVDYDVYTQQRWSLKTVQNTDYGVVNPAGIYDVDDYARCETEVDYHGKKIKLRMTASWKEGYDKQSITLFFRDGTTYEWEFGLCPAEAYGTMLTDLTRSDDRDIRLHDFLEMF